VVNKVDAAEPMALAELRGALPGAVFVSAQTGEGLHRLRARLAEELPHPDVELEVLLPYTEGALVARTHADGEVLAERHTAEGTVLHARVSEELAASLRAAAVDPAHVP
jgi:GTP-binding protein HflX